MREYEQAVKLVADHVSRIRACDVFRLLEWHRGLDGFPQWLAVHRPDLSSEIMSVLEELR